MVSNMKHYDRVYAEINLDRVRHNVEELGRRIKEETQIVAVIKTDGYGHGAVPIARELEPLERIFGFAVATIEEAMILRKAGIKKPILMLGFTFPYAYQPMIDYDIRPAVFQKEMAEELSKLALASHKICKIHIKVDTGMSRIGVRPGEEGVAFLQAIRNLSGITVEGIFSHFAKADETDKEPANKQIALFRDFVVKAEEILGYDIRYKHQSNSAGTIDLTEAQFDLVRPGIALYGLWPSQEVDKSCVDLKPALSLKSHIIYCKKINQGDQVSYGGIYTADRARRIATVPVGYGDGYPRSLSNKGMMLIHGKKAPILGRICMDQCMVDITEIPEAKAGDEVILIGESGTEQLTMDYVGEISGRFNYELACDLGKRIPRVYQKGGTIVATKDYFEDYE